MEHPHMTRCHSTAMISAPNLVGFLSRVSRPSKSSHQIPMRSKPPLKLHPCYSNPSSFELEVDVAIAQSRFPPILATFCGFWFLSRRSLYIVPNSEMLFNTRDQECSLAVNGIVKSSERYQWLWIWTIKDFASLLSKQTSFLISSCNS